MGWGLAVAPSGAIFKEIEQKLAKSAKKIPRNTLRGGATTKKEQLRNTRKA